VARYKEIISNGRDIMKEFDELVAALKQSRKKCPWAREVITKEHIERLKDEVRELKEAIKKGNKDEIRDELGDVIWDALFIAIIEEEKGNLTIDEIFEKAAQKLKRRKPWVFGNEVVKTPEEAVRRWNEIKQKERMDKAKNI